MSALTLIQAILVTAGVVLVVVGLCSLAGTFLRRRRRHSRRDIRADANRLFSVSPASAESPKTRLHITPSLAAGVDLTAPAVRPPADKDLSQDIFAEIFALRVAVETLAAEVHSMRPSTEAPAPPDLNIAA